MRVPDEAVEQAAKEAERLDMKLSRSDIRFALVAGGPALIAAELERLAETLPDYTADDLQMRAWELRGLVS